MRFIILSVLLLIFSCGNTTNPNEGSHNDAAYLDTNTLVQSMDVDSTLASTNDTIYLDINGGEYKYLGQIPDSLRTSEQDKLVQLISEVVVNYMAVENNHMVFKLSKEEFIAKWIPERYYTLLEENIRENNAFIDSEGIKDVDKMVEGMKDDFRSLYESKEP